MRCLKSGCVSSQVIIKVSNHRRPGLVEWLDGGGANSCKISCSDVERRGTPLYLINSLQQTPWKRFIALSTCWFQHPSIWVLLKSLQGQQVLTDNMLSHIAQGESKLPGTRARNAIEWQCLHLHTIDLHTIDLHTIDLHTIDLHTIDLIPKKLYGGLHLTT